MRVTLNQCPHLRDMAPSSPSPMQVLRWSQFLGTKQHIETLLKVCTPLMHVPKHARGQVGFTALVGLAVLRSPC